MSVPVRLALVAVVALCGTAVVANRALMTRAGVSPGCSIVRTGQGPELEACHAGWFKGYPSLVQRGCTSVGVTPKLQYWSCPAS
jgi:hypothetical protein